jgi:uncharacterized membrane protein YfhO
MNRALARGVSEPLFLYSLEKSRGRVAWEDSTVDPAPRLVSATPIRVEIQTEAKRNGRLILTELSYPGWQVRVDGGEAQPEIVEGVFRGVAIPEGNHSIVWNYRPSALHWGGGVSLITLAGLLAIGHIRYWHQYDILS